LQAVGGRAVQKFAADSRGSFATKEDTSAVTVQERTDLETADRAVIRLFTAEYS